MACAGQGAESAVRNHHCLLQGLPLNDSGVELEPVEGCPIRMLCQAQLIGRRPYRKSVEGSGAA
eukprot:498828-Pelagomonas_calceolata.AAC.5